MKAVALALALCAAAGGALAAPDARTVAETVSVRSDLSAPAAPLPRYWLNTGWCPPLPLRDMPEYVSTESSWQNHAFVAAVPRGGIRIVRIHNLLSLLRVPKGADPSRLDPGTIDFSRLDALVNLVAGEMRLDLGFELMGNPLFAGGNDDTGVFTSWKDASQLASWEGMVRAIASRYVGRLGVDTVARWRWEAWNEPDHACNSHGKMHAGIDCDLDSWLGYFDACARGLKGVSPRLQWGGPGSGGATLTTPFLTAMVKHVAAALAAGDNSTALDFIQWHDKGALTNTALDVAVVKTVQAASARVAATVPVGNEEADPLGGWNKVEAWRGDATYPAAAARVLNMHQDALREGSSGVRGVNFGYLANDNAFLNYGDQWFDQRTLMARFLMNKTGATEVVRKPVYNLMGVLAMLGGDKHNVTGAQDPQGSSVGVVVTSGRSPTTPLEREVAVLAYNSAGTTSCGDSSCSAELTVTLDNAAARLGGAGSRAVVTHYRIDQASGNPRAAWESFGGAANPYPTPAQFSALRRASELVVLSRSNVTVLDAPVVLTTTLPQPGVSLFHVCAVSSSSSLSSSQPLAPSVVPNVSVRATPTLDPPTVFVRWDAPTSGSGCIKTYEVLRSETRGGEFTRVNDVDTIFQAFVHAQGSPREDPPRRGAQWRGPPKTRWPALATRATGCYAVRAVSVWGGVGETSEPACLPGERGPSGEEAAGSDVHVHRWRAGVEAAARAASGADACGGLGNATDWLVHGCDAQAGLATAKLPDGSTAYVVANGVVSRTFVANASTGLLGTVSIAVLSGAGAGERLHPLSHPEAMATVNGVDVLVGGYPATGPGDRRPRARLTSSRASRSGVVAGGFHHVPGARGSDPNAAWPPRGVRVEFNHTVPCSDVGAGPTGVVTFTSSVELYSVTSSFGRRVRISHTCDQPLRVCNMSVTALSVLRDRSVTSQTDASVATGRMVADPFDKSISLSTMGFASTPGIYDFGPGVSRWAASDPPFETFFVLETVYDVQFDADPPVRGMSRYGLVYSRAMHVVAPQLEQNPVRVSAVCVGGAKVPPPDGVAGSAGSWCYDDEGAAGIASLLGQCAEAGVELVVFAQNMNATWRSFIGNEFQSAANISFFKGVVDRAHAGGIEVGSYELLLNARSATALNQAAPDDAANRALHPMAGYDTMDPATGMTCHKGGKTTCQGGPGCCAMCGATEFFDDLRDSVLAWWNATGVSAVDQDGAETQDECANASHAHHHGLDDSIWQQYLKVRALFHSYLEAPKAYASGPVPPVGMIWGMPGSVLDAGQSKVPGGYSENTYSLPRWVWIDRTRESVIAGAIPRDESVVVRQRMFPLPMSAPYHPQEPDPAHPSQWRDVTGYDSAATLSPLEDHVNEIEWALSTAFGTGAAPMIRGRKLWDGPNSEAAVKKWIAWAKRYRRVLSAEAVTLAHGTVCWGRDDPAANSTCTLGGLDATLHRAPKAFYPDIAERALAVVWNPTSSKQTATLAAPLYYAGFSAAAGATAALVSREGGAPARVPLGANDTVPLPVALGPRELTWFVVTES